MTFYLLPDMTFEEVLEMLERASGNTQDSEPIKGETSGATGPIITPLDVGEVQAEIIGLVQQLLKEYGDASAAEQKVLTNAAISLLGAHTTLEGWWST